MAFYLHLLSTFFHFYHMGSQLKRTLNKLLVIHA